MGKAVDGKLKKPFAKEGRLGTEEAAVLVTFSTLRRRTRPA